MNRDELIKALSEKLKPNDDIIKLDFIDSWNIKITVLDESCISKDIEIKFEYTEPAWCSMYYEEGGSF